MESVVTICGSMRFYALMLKAAEELTTKGVIVLMPFKAVEKDDQHSELKMMLDSLHKTKILMSESIVVVTDNTEYIGDSTKQEIDFAIQYGVKMRWQIMA